ncbi:MAG: d(CMP) kinase [Alphaproteobacteria bacterium]|jgi:cytidylate kinase
MIIAIDGPAAAGKGTLARRLAARFGLAYLDTGALYRAIAAKMLRAGGDPGNEDQARQAAKSLSPPDLDAPELREEAVGRAASTVAAHPSVRQTLIAFQHRFAESPPPGKSGAVLDGRDIGTVILPDARVKIFVTASAEVRADRRHKELRDRGGESIRAAVLREMAERDERDRARAVAPLVAAPDAYLLDTTNMDADAAFAAAVDYVLARQD